MSKDIKREQLLEALFDFQKFIGCVDNEMIADLNEGWDSPSDLANIYKTGYVHLKSATSKLIADMALLLNDNFDNEFEHMAPDCVMLASDWIDEDDDEEFTGFKECTCKPDLSFCSGTLGEHEKEMAKMDEDEEILQAMREDYEGTYYDLQGMDSDGDVDPDVIEDVDQDESFDDYYEEEFDQPEEEHECKCGGSCGGEGHECSCGGKCGDNCKCHIEEVKVHINDKEPVIYKPTTEEVVEAMMTENEELQKWQALEMLYSPIESLTEAQLIDLRRVYDRALLYLSENYKYKTVEEFIKAKHAIIRLNMDDLTLKDLGIKIVNAPKEERDDEDEE